MMILHVGLLGFSNGRRIKFIYQQSLNTEPTSDPIDSPT